MKWLIPRGRKLSPGRMGNSGENPMVPLSPHPLYASLTLCRPHFCQQCGVAVGHLGTHGLSCRESQGHFSRHAAIIDIVKRSLAVTKIPSHLNHWS